jgi:hypothetical protein
MEASVKKNEGERNCKVHNMNQPKNQQKKKGWYHILRTAMAS